MNKKLNQLDELLENEQEALIEHVQEDTGYHGDVELCIIKDTVTGIEYQVSFEDIVKKTVDRVRVALATFRELE
jgi:hypothetical protein